MIRLGIDCREFEVGKMTGIWRYLSALCRYLLRPGSEWDLRFFGNQKTDWESFIPDQLKRVYREDITWWWDQVQLPRFIRRERCQLFLSPYFKAPLFSSAPVVLIVNDLIPRNLYFRTLLRWNVRRAAGVVAISQATREALCRLTSAARSVTQVIPLGIPACFSPGPASWPFLKEKFSLERPYLLYVGNENRHKNLRALLSAFAQIPDYDLVLCGVNPKRDPALPTLAAARGILMRVHFIPAVSDEDLVAIYRAATLFIFPSLSEGFGLPPLEAMACGIPVVSSRLPATQEVLGKAAYFVNVKNVEEFAQGIRNVLAEPLLQNNLAREGKMRAAQFVEQEMASSIAEYLQFVAKKGAR